MSSVLPISIISTWCLFSAGTSEGGIVGWSYETQVPVINNLRKMPDSIKTSIPNVLQTGQWVYSPAGIPTAILTGWLAAHAVIKEKELMCY